MRASTRSKIYCLFPLPTRNQFARRGARPLAALVATLFAMLLTDAALAQGTPKKYQTLYRDLDAQRVAVELDRRIVKQPGWNETLLRAGAQIEIVHFVGGG